MPADKWNADWRDWNPFDFWAGQLRRDFGEHTATWTADGTALIYTSERNGSADLYRVRTDGTDLSGSASTLTTPANHTDQIGQNDFEEVAS